jgi:O-antigen biosynthesis protein
MFSSGEKDYLSIQTFSEESLDENNSSKKMLSLIGNKKNVLEFGCATGYFSQLLLARGCEVTGIEINADAAKVSEQYCKKVIVADLDFASLSELLPSQEFDVAVFGDVLEHLRNPWKVLDEARRLLKPDGYVVASIPNITHGAIRLSLLKGKFEYTKVGILDDTHLRFFSRYSVENLFTKSGYTVDYIDRTKLPIFCNSNLVPQLNEDDFHKELIDQVKQDSEADTLQFILRAYPSTLENRYMLLSNQYQRVLEQVESLQSELKHTELELKCTQSELENSSLTLRSAQEELQSIKTSKFWKIKNFWFRFRKVNEIIS